MLDFDVSLNNSAQVFLLIEEMEKLKEDEILAISKSRMNKQQMIDRLISANQALSVFIGIVLGTLDDIKAKQTIQAMLKQQSELFSMLNKLEVQYSTELMQHAYSNYKLSMEALRTIIEMFLLHKDAD